MNFCSPRRSVRGARLAILLGLAAAATPSPAGAAEGLSLAEALHQAGAGNDALRASGEAVAEARELRGVADALVWPTVEMHARAVRMDDPLRIDLSPLRGLLLELNPGVPPSAIPPLGLDVLDRDFARADVRFFWPLYAGGKITAARRAGQARVEAAEALHGRENETLAADVVERYFALRLALDAVDVRREVLADLERHVADATRLEAEGQIARADLLHAEVARAEADRALKRALHDVALARVALADLLGVAEVASAPTTPLFAPRDVPQLDFFRDRARAENPLLAALDARRRAADAAADAERAARRPEVVAFGSRELRTTDLTVLDPTWSVGVEARFTLFDGLARPRRIAAAEAAAREASYARRQAARDVGTAVERWYRELARAREQYEALGAARALAEENLRTRRRGFDEAMATSLEVVDARVALAAVRLETLAAERDFDVALGRLLAAARLSSSYFDYLPREDAEVTR